METIISFLTQVRKNNNKPWFDSNRKLYAAAKGEFEGMVGEIIEGLSAADPSVRGLTVKDCTYRINRDIRFSTNKDPYKTHFGAYICPNGKKSGYAGYYLHIEPDQNGKGAGFLTSGIYMPEPKVLKSVREEIFDNGASIMAAVKKAKGFKLGEENKLKRTPTGFPTGTEFDELIKLKDLYVDKPITESYLMDKNFARNVIADFTLTTELTGILNRAVKFAYEEM